MRTLKYFIYTMFYYYYRLQILVYYQKAFLQKQLYNNLQVHVKSFLLYYVWLPISQLHIKFLQELFCFHQLSKLHGFHVYLLYETKYHFFWQIYMLNNHFLYCFFIYRYPHPFITIIIFYY